MRRLLTCGAGGFGLAGAVLFGVASYSRAPEPAPNPLLSTSQSYVVYESDNEDSNIIRFPPPDPVRNGAITFCTQNMVTHFPYRCQVIKRWIGGIEQLEL